MSPNLKIGQIATQSGVSIQTLRYYDRIGLVEPSGHKTSGYRLYTPNAVKKIIFIKNAQNLGFTLKEIRALLKLKVDKKARSPQVRKKVSVKIKLVEKKIRRLQGILGALKDLVQCCHGNKPTGDCPILKSLEKSKIGG